MIRKCNLNFIKLFTMPLPWLVTQPSGEIKSLSANNQMIAIKVLGHMLPQK